MKRGSLIPFVILIFLIGFISSQQYYSPSQGRPASISDFFNSIPPSTMILGTLFVIFFALIYFSTLRFFKGDKAISGITSFAVALLITYGINKTNLNVANLFYGMGISSGFLYTFVPILFLIAAVFVGIKFGFRIVFLIFGGTFIFISFTEMVYEKTTLFIIGAILTIIGIWLIIKKKRKGGVNFNYPPRSFVNSPYNDYEPGRVGGRGLRGRRGSSGERGLGGGRRPPREREPHGEDEYYRRLKEKKREERQYKKQQIYDERKEKRMRKLQRIEEQKMLREQKQAKMIEYQQKKQITEQKRLQITSNLQSLIQTYNEIQRQNPADPRLMDIAREIKRIRREKR